MRRDVFKRGVRMTHRFDKLEGTGDPMNSGTFDPNFPVFPSQSSKPLSARRLGEHSFGSSTSPVVKPGGVRASLNGPAPDYPDVFAAPVPANTKKRKS